MFGRSKKQDGAEEARDAALDEDVAQAEAEIQAEEAAKAAPRNADAGKPAPAKAKGGPERAAKPVKQKKHFWTGADPIFMSCFIVFILATTVVVGNTVNDNYISTDAKGDVVDYGDKLLVDYVGSYYGWYDEDGSKVFDTSLWSVASDSDYAKSYEFDLKSKSSYKPLDAKIGSNKLLAMFEDSLIGHHVGDTVRVEIPCAEGYGELKDADVKTAEKGAGTVAASFVLEKGDFKELFDADAPKKANAAFTFESPYGWPAEVTSLSDRTVSVRYVPTVGEEYEMNSEVKVKVTSAAEGEIGFEYVFEYGGKLIEAVVGNEHVYINGVGDDGTFTYKTADEKVGETLFFEIEIVDFAKEEKK